MQVESVNSAVFGIIMIRGPHLIVLWILKGFSKQLAKGSKSKNNFIPFIKHLICFPNIVYVNQFEHET